MELNYGPVPNFEGFDVPSISFDARDSRAIVALRAYYNHASSHGDRDLALFLEREVMPEFELFAVQHPDLLERVSPPPREGSDDDEPGD